MRPNKEDEKEMTQQEVAERLGCSRQHVARLERKAIREIRAAILADDAIVEWFGLEKFREKHE